MLVPGIRASFELLNNPDYYHKILKIFVDFNNKNLLKDLEQFPQIKNKIMAKDKFALDKIYQNHQGIILDVNFDTSPEADLETYITKNNPQVIVMLDSINDPHNLGASIRSSEVLAKAPIIVAKDGTAPINETVAKTSAGAIFHTNVFVVNNLSRTMENLKKLGFWVYVLDSNSTSQSLFETKFVFPALIIMGSEEKGPQRLLKERSDFSVYIPMKGTVESLNVSVACGITVYEVAKQLCQPSGKK